MTLKPFSISSIMYPFEGATPAVKVWPVVSRKQVLAALALCRREDCIIPERLKQCAAQFGIALTPPRRTKTFRTSFGKKYHVVQ